MLPSTTPLTFEAYKAELMKYSEEDYLMMLHHLVFDLRSKVNPLTMTLELLQEENLTEEERQQVVSDGNSLAQKVQLIVEALSDYTEDRLRHKSDARHA